MSVLSENMKEAIIDAELVFVGIGSEMQVKLGTLKEIPNFAEKLGFLETHEEWNWLIPFLIRYYLGKNFILKFVRRIESLRNYWKEKTILLYH